MPITLPTLATLATLALRPPLALAEPPAATAPPDAEAMLREAIADRVDAMAREIETREASRDRGPLLARKFTIDTFLGVGTVLATLHRGGVPDPFPLWRFDFRDASRPLEAMPHAAVEAAASGAWLAAFEVVLLEAVAGDDPVAIAGSVLVDGTGAAILANWCEPCLAPLAVDFPILPEAFLLEWNEVSRRVVASHPIVARHAEATANAPPALDQPEDLYDLFDGLRPLPWLASPPPAGRPHEPAAIAGDAASRDERGARLQQVSWRREASDRPSSPREDRLRIEVMQPAISIRWRSGETFLLKGERHGETFRRASLRPEGALRQHPEGLAASIEARRIDGIPTRIDAAVRRGDAVVATLRWTGIESIADAAAEAIRRSWREVALDGDAWRSLDGRWAAAHPQGPALQARRRAVLAAMLGGDRAAFASAASAWRQAIRSRGLPEDLELRAWEQLAAWRASQGDEAGVDAIVSGPWREAIATLSPPRRCELAESRLRQGRFAAAILLAMPSEGAAGPAPSPPESLPWWFGEILAQAAGSEAQRPRMAWIEPPGRARLDRLVAAGLAEAIARPAAPSREKPRDEAARPRPPESLSSMPAHEAPPRARSTPPSPAPTRTKESPP